MTPAPGYAPAKYRTKQWPPEALVEDWYSPAEVLRRFAFAVSPRRQFIDTERAPRCLDESDTRTRLPRTAAAENASEPPDVGGKKVGYTERYALDVALGGVREL